MDGLLLGKALILGVVEGLTEFLPISSTGHLILAGDLLGFSDEKAKVFEIVIQTGAMFAIVWEYRGRFGRVLAGLATEHAAQRFALNLLVVPALVAAGAYDFWKNRALFDSGDLGMFAVGSAAAFVSAFLCVRWLLRYIATHDFTPFAWYRIAFGAAVLLTAQTGVVNWSAG